MRVKIRRSTQVEHVSAFMYGRGTERDSRAEYFMRNITNIIKEFLKDKTKYKMHNS